MNDSLDRQRRRTLVWCCVYYVFMDLILIFMAYNVDDKYIVNATAGVGSLLSTLFCLKLTQEIVKLK